MLQPRKGLEFDASEPVRITIAPNAGACFGVVRAIKLGRAALRRSQGNESSVFSFGPLIHNPQVVKELEGLGIKTVQQAEEVTDGAVILRSHGVRKEIEKTFREKGLQIVDATCPLVKKPQRIAAGLAENGYFLVVVGDAEHPEVKGVLSYFRGRDCLVTYKADDVDRIPSSVDRVGVIAQTTIEVEVFDRVVERVKSRFQDVVVYNTICDATSVRQREAVALAKGADVIIVVGGKNSSNTNKLVKICKRIQADTYHIEYIDEVQREWFNEKKRIGITGGASTPPEFVDRIGRHIASLIEATE